MFSGEEDLVAASLHVSGHSGVEAEREHVRLVCREGEPDTREAQPLPDSQLSADSLARLVRVLPAEQMVARGVRHHEVHLLAGDLRHIELSRDQDVLVYLFSQTFPTRWMYNE